MRGKLVSFFIAFVPIFSFTLQSTRADDEVTDLIVRGATWEESPQDVPSSMTIVRPGQTGAAQDNNFADVITQIPNLNWSGGSSRPRFFQIRGIGELEQYTGAPNPSVATIIDDIDFSGLGIFVPLFDVEQVEVLRGPQGLRYGSSALAGLINLRSTDPSAAAGGAGEFSVGTDDLINGGFAVGGPIEGLSDDFQFRMSVFGHHSDGFRDDVFLGRDDTNDRNEFTSRIKLRYAPSSDFKVDLTGLWVENDNGYDAFAIDNSFDTESDRPGRDALSVQALALKVTGDPTESVRVISTTTAYQSDQEYSFDGDWGNNPFWEPFAPIDYFSSTDRGRSVLSQEFRATSTTEDYVHGESFQWLGGLYGQRLMEGAITDQRSEDVTYDFIDSAYRADTGAAFGEAELPIVTGTSFRVGGRVERRLMGYNDSQASSFNPGDSMYGLNFSLNHDLSESIRAYGLVSRGFKGGGFNSGPRIPVDRRVYEPEYQWNFEVGIKSTWLNNRLTADVAVFHALRRDAQLKLAIQDDPADPLSFTFLTESSARARDTGTELESRYRLTSWLQLIGSGSLLHTDYTDVPEENAGLLHRDQSHAPEWQYSTGALITPTENTFLRVGISGKGAFYFDDSHDVRSDPYHLVNVAVGVREGRWSWTIWARNVFDENYAERGFFFGNEPPNYENKKYIQRGDPAQVGTTVTYKF